MTLLNAPESATVACDLRGEVLVVTIDRAPVNALNSTMRKGLVEAIDTAESNPSIRAVVVIGAGRNFIAEADIREFDKSAQPPMLSDVCDRIEACSKPVIAAIHGAALGGGLEIALASHYRLAIEGAKLGLPEVHLGLLPGAGGTQRAARLLGAEAALSLMLSGGHVSNHEALRLGLVDRVGQGDDAIAEGLAYAQELIAPHIAPRRTRDAHGLANKEASAAAITAGRTLTAKTSRGLMSPVKIVDCVEAAAKLPFDEGMRFEREQFLQCRESTQRAGLVHAFLAEREVQKSPETRNAKPRAIQSAGVVGGGTMGAGIVVALLDAGLLVTMIERDDDALERGRAHVEKVYDGLFAKGRMTSEAKASSLERLSGDTSYDALAGADIVIEAVFEDMGAKKTVFAALDLVCKQGAVLATNTSYLDIDDIAVSISRPSDVIGLHFFSPANIMKLLEVVVPSRVSADVVATGFALAKKLRKVGVRAGVCDGFIGNRMLATYRAAADHVMEDGASPYLIDQPSANLAFPWARTKLSISRAGTSVGLPESAALRRAIPARATYGSRMNCASAAGLGRRRPVGSTVTRMAHALASPTTKCCRLSLPSVCVQG